MPELLLEIGCEELPASFVEKAFKQLRDEVVARLGEERLSHGEARCYGTPRRLIAVVESVAERQPDATKEQRGPSLSAAYDASGEPTKALEGFCRSQGVQLGELRKDGEYVWVTKHIPGRPAVEVLAELLPASVRALSFEKSMRWGQGRMRFARPIRWIVALLGGQVVPFDVEGVPSDNLSRGHRFLSPDPILVQDFESYGAALRRAHVEFDPERRRAIMMDAARALVPDGVVDADEAIVDENVYLTEWPMPSLGRFSEEYLSLPAEVLVVAMKKHEKFFPVRDAKGKLTNRFISVRNGGDEKTVIWGNEWVLGARFNDAKFFFDEDSKVRLSDFASRLDRIVFQEKLGSVAQKAQRLVGLAAKIAESLGWGAEETGWARRAAELCKADLACGLVSELPALQGVIGGEYARRDGEPEAVCQAIRHHYNPTQPPADAGAKLARILMAADRVDTLVGYLGLGLVPSGSSDPFGLRRAANMLILNGRAWDFPELGSLASWSESFYRNQGHSFDADAIGRELREICIGRYELLHADVRHDLLDAVLGAPGWGNAKSVASRVALLAERSADPSFVADVRTFTRAGNIVAAAEKKGLTLAPDLHAVQTDCFESEPERVLHTVAAGLADEACSRGDRQDFHALYDLLRDRLARPITEFFDTTMVMVEDGRVRDNRLTLLAAIAAMYLRIADFSKVVIEG